ncbi:hypothetical protein P8452_23074 [Trifolium repens]|nr:hypothetical protein P8452_23074 [Trifolium repens]
MNETVRVFPLTTTVLEWRNNKHPHSESVNKVKHKTKQNNKTKNQNLLLPLSLLLAINILTNFQQVLNIVKKKAL